MDIKKLSTRLSLAALLLALAAARLPAQSSRPATELQQLSQRLRETELRLAELESSGGRAAAEYSSDITAISFDDEEPPADSIATRLADLEKSWDKFQSSEQSKKEAAASKPTFKMGGRIHYDSTWFPDTSEGIGFFENPATGADPEDRFFFRRIRLEMQGDILETMLWRIQLDFNTPDTPEYKDIYIGFDELPWNHTVLVGNQKRPLGLDHLNSSRYNVFMERPLVVEAFNPDARRMGVAAYAYTDDLRYTIRYGVYNLENTRSSGSAIADALQLSGNARLTGNPWYDETSGGRGYFHWGVAGMVAAPDGSPDATASNVNEARFSTRPELRSDSSWIDTARIAGAEWYEIAAVEGILNVGPLQIVGEYQGNWLQRDAVTPGSGPDVCFHGGYVYAHYMLTQEHVPYDRETSTLDRLKPFENFFLVDRFCGGHGVGYGLGAWGVGARLSYLDLSDGDILGGEETNITLGVNWWWTAYSKLQMNFVWGEIDNHRPQGGFTEGDFFGFSTRMQADF